MSITRTIRHLLVGVGANVFGMHRSGLKLPTTEVVGVTDLDPQVAQRVADRYGYPFYADYETMLREAEADVVSVLTPHPSHAEQAIAALDAGYHVLVEKPIAVHIAEADRMVEAAKRNDRVLAVNFQQRLRPEIMAAYQLIREGKLGRIQNVDMKITWTRTAIYYRGSTWRGTWNGEGGGVLMNQAPHELDLVCHLIGLPARVHAWARTIQHQIETEDTIQAMLEWPDGALGSVHISTAEAGQPQRFEILGTRGRLEIGKGALHFQQFDTDLEAFLVQAEDGFAAPKLAAAPVEIGAGEGNHAAIYQNLHAHLLDGAELAAPGEDAKRQLELANAMNYSSYTNQTVNFPLDRQAYADLLDDLRAGRRTAPA